MSTDAIEQAAALAAALESAVPTGKQKMLAQFNRTSGVYVNTISLVPLEVLNTEHYIYVEVELDPETQRVEGNIDSFKVVDIASSATKIYESQVNASCKEKIYKRFQPEVQLDILRNVLAIVCEKLEISDESFDDMNDYIDSVKRANKVLKQAYIDNPDFQFITIAEEQAESEAKLDGGLHEVMGPKNLLGIGLYTTK